MSISELLPWYVNGTLSSDERTKVSTHLEDCSECRSTVNELRRIAAVVAKDQTTPIVPQPPVNEFISRLDDRGASPAARSNAPWYAMAACLLALVGAVFSAMTLSPDPNVFRTVTDPSDESLVSYVFAIEFAEGVDENARQSVAGALANAEILESTEGYRIVVGMPSATMSELNAFANELRQMDGIERVDVVGVQVPFE